MTDYAQKVLMLGVDDAGDTKAVHVDRFNGAITSIEYEHEQIHSHKGFGCSGKTTVTAGASYSIFMINPTANYPHLRFFQVTTTGGPCDIELFESAGISATGSACGTLIDHNRNSAVTPNMTVYVGGAPATDGTLIKISGTTGTKHSTGSGEGFPNEFDLLQSAGGNTVSHLKITNNSGGNITAWTELFWYEA